MFFLLIFSIYIIGLILFFTNGFGGLKKGKRRMIAVAILLLPLIMLAFVKITKGFVPIPLWMRSITHSIFEPEDLYKPIVTDDFLFYEKGFTRTYTLKPKYLDYYMIGFVSGKQNISREYKVKGKLKAEFFWKDKFLFEKVATSQCAFWQSDNDHAHYKGIDLIDFEVPLNGKYKDDISVRLTVLEPDEGLKEYGDSIRLSIAVSAIP